MQVNSANGFKCMQVCLLACRIKCDVGIRLVQPRWPAALFIWCNTCLLVASGGALDMCAL